MESKRIVVVALFLSLISTVCICGAVVDAVVVAIVYFVLYEIDNVTICNFELPITNEHGIFSPR